MGHGTRQLCRICVWDVGLACLDDPHRPEKILPFQTPLKNGPTGADMEARVLSLLQLGKPHTSPHRQDSGELRLCWQLVFGISSFSGPIPKVLFFVYAAQFLYRKLHPSPPLIMFYRTLLGDMETLSFPFHRCDKMCFLKLPQNWPKPVFLGGLVLFPYLD